MHQNEVSEDSQAPPLIMAVAQQHCGYVGKRGGATAAGDNQCEQNRQQPEFLNRSEALPISTQQPVCLEGCCCCYCRGRWATSWHSVADR